MTDPTFVQTNKSVDSVDALNWLIDNVGDEVNLYFAKPPGGTFPILETFKQYRIKMWAHGKGWALFCWDFSQQDYDAPRPDWAICDVARIDDPALASLFSLTFG